MSDVSFLVEPNIMGSSYSCMQGPVDGLNEIRRQWQLISSTQSRSR